MKEGAQCPTCDRTDFKSKHGMKIHHFQAHDESLAKKIVECEECSETFEILEDGGVAISIMDLIGMTYVKKYWNVMIIDVSIVVQKMSYIYIT